MNALWQWMDDRTAVRAALGNCTSHVVPGGPSWQRVWPGAILFTFVVQACTGFVLWSYYSPSAQTAWESVYYVQQEVTGGWLLRAIHHYSAQLALVLVGLYLIQMIATGACRAPRELIFWTAVLMGLVTLALMLTGDLLPWNRNGFSATQVRVEYLKVLPWIGEPLFRLAVGGTEFGHLTLTRFLALHIGIFAGSLLVLLVLHSLAIRRADAAEIAAGKTGSPAWPGQALRTAVVSVAVLAVILTLAQQHGISGPHAGVALGSPADPANKYEAARPEWAFLGLYEFAHLFPGELAIVPVFLTPGIILLIVLLMPLVGRSRAGRIFNVAFLAAILLGDAALSWQTLERDREDADHQAAIVAENQQADRMLQLVNSPRGIPATGALTLLRDDPLTQGPRLFKQHCASCHDHAGGDAGDIKAEKPSAPNLRSYASRPWLAGLLDARQIVGPNYFGNTALRGGKMVGFVKESLAGLDAEEKKDLAKAVAALSAEARLPSQRQADAQDAEAIKAGRGLIVDDFGCMDCHKFHEKGRLGIAPELTGYGSRPWIMGIISNPAHKRFYGARNDRMPAYAPSPDDPAQNLLTAKEIELLALWLRGEWYR